MPPRISGHPKKKGEGVAGDDGEINDGA
jgi:hypothetical protein